MKRLKQWVLLPRTNCGFGLVALALVLVWPAHGADPVLIGQWPGWPRGYARGVAASGSYAYVAAEGAGLQLMDMTAAGGRLRHQRAGQWRDGQRDLRLRGR